MLLLFSGLSEAFLDAFCELADYIRENLVLRVDIDGWVTGRTIVRLLGSSTNFLKETKRNEIVSKLVEVRWSL